MDDRSVGEKVGPRLRELREAAQITQAEVAAAAQKTVETISNFERGKTVPSVATLFRLAEVMDASVHDMFDTSLPPRPEEPDVAAITRKWRRLGETDKDLLNGIIDLMLSRAKRP